MPTRLSFFGLKIQESPTVRRVVLITAGALLLLLVLLEWRIHLDVSLGILYTFPVAIAAVMLTRGQVLLLAVACAVIRGQFTPDLSQLETVLRFLMAMIAYAGAGLLVVEMSNNRRRLLEHFARLDLEQRLRRKAEEQLRILVESSPAAILTLDAESRVAAANRAAHEMFGYPPGGMKDASIAPHLPVFQHALSYSPGGRPVRSSLTGWARRCDGSTFPLQAWFSTYGTGSEHALAAILVDMSEEVRERELENFRHLVDHHRLLAGAVSHEIRNLCSAISVVCANLAKEVPRSGSADFEALQHLVRGLTRLASVELRRDRPAVTATDLRTVLDQMMVVIEPDWTEMGGKIRMELDDGLPPVQSDAHGLLQIFLNLSQNSCRAVANVENPELLIAATWTDGDVTIRFEDTGAGIADPSVLFQPFRPEADGSGLGLYISRELARSFGGDLVYVATERGCRFDLTLPRGVARI